MSISRRRAEGALIGALLLDSSAIGDITPFLRTDHFADRNLGTIYTVMREMWGQGHTIDHRSVKHELKSRGLLDRIGGIQGLIDIVNECDQPNYALTYAEVVAGVD